MILSWKWLEPLGTHLSGKHNSKPSSSPSIKNCQVQYYGKGVIIELDHNGKNHTA